MKSSESSQQTMKSTKMEEFLTTIPELRDEQRVRGLFSSFSQPRSTNPEAFDERLHFWRTLLLNASRRGIFDGRIFQIPESNKVAMTFSSFGSRPLGIGYVMGSLVKSGDAYKQNMYQDVDESILLKLSKMIISTPLKIGWRWLSDSDTDDTIDSDCGFEHEMIILSCLLEVPDVWPLTF